MRRGLLKFQIGKNGINVGLIEGLNLAFKKHKTIRIGILKSAANERERIKEIAGKIADKLEGNYNWRVIGFTIIMKKIGIRKKKQSL